MSKMKLLQQVLNDLNNLNQSISDLMNALENKQEVNHDRENLPIITLEEVRGVLAEKSRDGLTKEVKDLIQSFGASRLSEIKASDYPLLLEKAKELKHE